MKPLNIAKIDTVARILGNDIQFLQSIAQRIDRYYVEELKQKKSGEIRILHKPRYSLKVVQKNIKKSLSTIPLPDSVHGWVKGRSVKSAVAPHGDMKFLYCFDIHSYFDSVYSERVYTLFTKKLRCKPDVARFLTRLSTYKKSLPQGSPCSPVIANLILYDFDVSINSYAKKRQANYSRLGDDIILSSETELLDIERVIIAGLRRYGLKINSSKTQFGKPKISGTKVLGVVIGSGISISRRYRKDVRAILHNAQKTGLNMQNLEGRFNFREHLLGRIGFIEMFCHMEGQKLRKNLNDTQD